MYFLWKNLQGYRDLRNPLHLRGAALEGCCQKNAWVCKGFQGISQYRRRNLFNGHRATLSRQKRFLSNIPGAVSFVKKRNWTTPGTWARGMASIRSSKMLSELNISLPPSWRKLSNDSLVCPDPGNAEAPTLIRPWPQSKIKYTFNLAQMFLKANSCS